VGTKLLRAYMHGYFVDQRLYKKAKAITMPFAYDQYRQERVQQKLEEERRTRITVERKVRGTQLPQHAACIQTYVGMGAKVVCSSEGRICGSPQFLTCAGGGWSGGRCPR
jgi:hypothetical protein